MFFLKMGNVVMGTMKMNLCSRASYRADDLVVDPSADEMAVASQFLGGDG